MEEGDVLFEEWLWKLSGKEGQGRVLRLSSMWKKRFCSLKHINDKPYLCFYKAKPQHDKQYQKDQVLLTPICSVVKRLNVCGKPFALTITTSTRILTFGTDNEKLFHLFAFFLQTFTVLKDSFEEECYVVRPHNQAELHQLGAKGSICLLHLSPGGVTLALQLSKSVIAQWPLSCIRNYESSGTGQFTLDAGKRSPQGEGLYRFITRATQDDEIFDKLDSYVMVASNARQSNRRSQHDIAVTNELNHLRSLTYISKERQFSSHHRRISRDIYDTLWQHLSSRKQKSRNDTSFQDEQSRINRSASVPVLDFNTTMNISTISDNNAVHRNTSINSRNSNQQTPSSPIRNFGYLHPTSLHSPSADFNPQHSRQWSAPVHHPVNDPQASSDPLAQFQQPPNHWSPSHNVTGPSGGFFTTPRKPRNQHPPVQGSVSHPQTAVGPSSHLRTIQNSPNGKQYLRENPPEFARHRDRLKSRSFDDLNFYMQMTGFSVPPNHGVTNNTFEMEDDQSYTENPTNLVYTYTTNRDPKGELPPGPEDWRNIHTAPKQTNHNTTNPTVQYSSAVGSNDLRKTKSNPSLVVGLSPHSPAHGSEPHSPPHTYEPPPVTPPGGSAQRNFKSLALQPNVPPDNRLSTESNFSQGMSSPVKIIQQTEVKGINVTSHSRAYRKQKSQQPITSPATTPGNQPAGKPPSLPTPTNQSGARIPHIPTSINQSVNTSRAPDQSEANSHSRLSINGQSAGPSSEERSSAFSPPHLKRVQPHSGDISAHNPINRHAHRLPSLPDQPTIDEVSTLGEGTFC